MYYYLLSKGEYDNYFSLEFAHPEKLTEDEVIERILSKYDEAKAEVERLEIRMWDECEQIFGIREWPYQSCFIGIKGTERDFLEWRDRWDRVFPIYRELVFAAKLAGFEFVHPTVHMHFEWGIEEFFENGGEDKMPADEEDEKLSRI
jgi:hypothetical protein